MAQRFHPSHWHKPEDPRRLEELPPEIAYYEPGSLTSFHIAMVGEKPAS